MHLDCIRWPEECVWLPINLRTGLRGSPQGFEDKFCKEKAILFSKIRHKLKIVTLIVRFVCKLCIYPITLSCLSIFAMKNWCRTLCYCNYSEGIFWIEDNTITIKFHWRKKMNYFLFWREWVKMYVMKSRNNNKVFGSHRATL